MKRYAFATALILSLLNFFTATPYAYAAAITYDNSAHLAPGTTTATPSSSYTMGACANGVILLLTWTNGNIDTTSATYNGVAMTATAAGTSGEGANVRVRGFYLLNPASGSNTVAAVFSGSSSNWRFLVSSYCGVTAVDDVKLGSDSGSQVTSGSINITSSHTGDWGVLMTTNGGGATPTGTGNTNTVRLSISGLGLVGDSNASLGASGTYAMGATWSPTTDWWYGAGAFALAPVATAATFNPWQFWVF